MAQGQIKKSASSANKASTTNSHKNKVTKKYLGNKNPKKQSLIKAAKINKKFTSGLTAQTERMLGEKAGHLEMLGQGRSTKKTGGVVGGGANGKGKQVKKR